MLRTAATAAVVGLVALSLVVTQADTAAAATNGPGRLSVPSSVIGSLDDATPAERARMVANTVPRDPGLLPDGTRAPSRVVPAGAKSPLVKPGLGAAATRTLGVAGVGLTLGFGIGSTAARWAGYDEDEVGLAALFPNVPDVAFTPNADVTVTAPGWTGSARVEAPAHYASGVYRLHEFQVELTDAPAFQGTGTGLGSIRAVATVIGTENVPSNSTSYQVRGICIKSDTGAPIGLSGRTITPSNTSTSGGVFSVDIPLGCSATDPLYKFDRVDVQYGANIIATWYPPGHVSRPADVAPDPARVFETRWACAGSAEVLTARSEAFTESAEQYPPTPSATCPAGVLPSWSELWSVSLDEGAEDVMLRRWEPTTELQDWATNYPQCVTDECALDLLRIDGSTSLSCFSEPGACVDWWSTPEPTRSARYQCTYGGEVLPLDECSAYAPTFNVAVGKDVQTASGPRPAGQTAPYADPATGQPQPGESPSTDPEQQPFTPTLEGCPPPFELDLGGLGYWVTKGTLCALHMAFVPQRPVAERFDPFMDALRDVPPVSWHLDLSDMVEGINAPGGAGPVGGDCPDWTVTVGQWSADVICDSTYTEAIRTARPVLTGLMFIAAFAPLLRSLFYAVMPLLRATPK